MRDKIIELLGNGVSQRATAEALGVDESYVSQLMSEEGVQEQVLEARSVKTANYVKLDNTIDAGESRALDRVIKSLDYPMKPLEVLKVFNTLNAAKRKTASQDGGNHTTTIVTLQLPAILRAHMKMSADKQVIEVEGRPLVTLGADKVNAMLAEKRALEMLDGKLETIPTPELLERLF